MKKYLLVLGFFIAGMNQLNAQYYDNLNFNINDSIKLVASTKSAAKKIDILMNIGYRYEWSKGDSAIIYFKTCYIICSNLYYNHCLEGIYFYQMFNTFNY